MNVEQLLSNWTDTLKVRITHFLVQRGWVYVWVAQGNLVVFVAPTGLPFRITRTLDIAKAVPGLHFEPSDFAQKLPIKAGEPKAALGEAMEYLVQNAYPKRRERRSR